MSGKTTEICEKNIPKLALLMRQFRSGEAGFVHTPDEIIATAREAEMRLFYAEISEADSVGAVAIATRACPEKFEGRWEYGTEILMIRGEKSWEITSINLCRVRAGGKEKLDISINDTTLSKEKKSMLRRIGIKIRQPV